MAKKPAPPSPVQIAVKLPKNARDQLHYLLVERAITSPDEKPTISRIILEALGKLARAKGWREKR